MGRSMGGRIALAAALALAVTAPGLAAEPAAKVSRVGFLQSAMTLADNSEQMASFVRGLAERGHIVGRDVVIERRAAEGRLERLPGLLQELLAVPVDVVVTGGYPAALAAKQAAGKVPVVVFGAGDPVATGLTESLAHPGGNLTGVSDVATELSMKRLQLLQEMAPELHRVAILWNAGDRGMTLRYEAVRDVAPTLGVSVQPLGVREPGDFDGAFAAMDREPPDAIMMVSDSLTRLNRHRVFDYAAQRRLPSVYEIAFYPQDGGLMSYGPDLGKTFERVAYLVHRILKGASPAELPFEQPTAFELVINLKTAKALGLTIPPAILARADRVIE